MARRRGQDRGVSAGGMDRPCKRPEADEAVVGSIRFWTSSPSMHYSVGVLRVVGRV
jgi:hypothetical protein